MLYLRQGQSYDIFHWQLTLHKISKTTNCTLSADLRAHPTNSAENFCFSVINALLENPETKQVPRTLEAAKVLGTAEAKLACKTPEVLKAQKSQWRHPTELEFSLVSRTPEQFSQKSSKETETKEQKTYSPKTNSGINTQTYNHFKSRCLNFCDHNNSTGNLTQQRPDILLH